MSCEFTGQAVGYQGTGQAFYQTFISMGWSLFIFNYYYYYLLYNIVLILPYINMHPPRVYMRSPS